MESDNCASDLNVTCLKLGRYILKREGAKAYLKRLIEQLCYTALTICSDRRLSDLNIFNETISEKKSFTTQQIKSLREIWSASNRLKLRVGKPPDKLYCGCR